MSIVKTQNGNRKQFINNYKEDQHPNNKSKRNQTYLQRCQ